MKRLVIFVLVAQWLVGVAAAQTVTSTSGAINGRVVDNTGGVIPGVTVTIASPAMMGVRTVMTNDEGMYRFPAVPPGSYRVIFELSGFRTVEREDIRVGLGFTATVNADMAISSLEENVTVTGESPVVDTQATTINTTFSADALKSLPFTGEYWAMLSITPAVNMARMDVGGSEAMNPVNSTVYGQSRQGRSMVEGIAATYSDGGGSNVYYADFNSFSEVALNTSGTDSESPTAGMQAQFISKSGGNQFRGSFYFDYENGDWQTHNIDERQLALGVTGGAGVSAVDTNRLVNYRKFAADAGGYAAKDRVWWYYSFSHLQVERRLVNVIDTTQKTSNPTHSGKVTYKATRNMNFIGYAQTTHKQQNPYLSGGTGRVPGGSAIYQPGSAWRQSWKSGVYKGEWNQVLSDSMFAEARVGNYYSYWRNLRLSDGVRSEDLGTGILTGGAHPWDEYRDRPQALGSLSYFKDGWAGSHNFKLGLEVAKELLQEDEFGFQDNIAMLFNNGTPVEVMFFDGANTMHNGLWNQAAFFTDVWRVNSRLTFNLGVRYDRYRSFLDEQRHQPGFNNPSAIVFPAVSNLVTWNHVVPRVGVIYDLLGKGKTALKVNYGDYYYNPSTILARGLNPNQALWSYRYRWDDVNGDRQFQVNERGALLQNVGGAASIRIDPNLENTYTRRATLMLEHEILPNFGVRTGFVWVGVRDQRTNVNQNRPFDAFTVPITVRDPGPDGRIGTADDGGTVAALNLDPRFVGLPTVNITQNVPEANDDFYTYEVTADKRMTKGWSMQASFAHTWNRQSNLGAFTNPNLRINRIDGRDHSTTWQAKLSGTFELLKGIRVSPLMRHQAGQAYGRTFNATLNSGSTTLLAEPFNANRMRNPTILDARVEKGFRLTGERRFAAFFDIYNIFNSNAENSIGTASGASWQRPLSIISPRVAKLGLKMDW
jgi:outer membrane receptor protein involved in Fe transport